MSVACGLEYFRMEYLKIPGYNGSLEYVVDNFSRGLTAYTINGIISNMDSKFISE